VRMVSKMNPSPLITSALAAALVAAASVLVFSVLPALFVWAAFIGWASYDHSGATAQAAMRSSAALVFGVVMAWLVALVVASDVLPLTTTASTATAAGIASFLIVIASRSMMLSIVPATFYGFASTFACLSLSNGAFTLPALTSFGLQNVLFGVPASLLIGTVLGITHGWLANVIATREARSQRRLGLSRITISSKESKQ
jgi:Protein of unknown function (DUF1097)